MGSQIHEQTCGMSIGRWLFVVVCGTFMFVLLYCVSSGTFTLSKVIPLEPRKELCTWNISRRNTNAEQRQRQLTMLGACNRNKTCPKQEELLAKDLDKQGLYLVDDEYKAIFCYIPKAGCTMWKIKLVSLHSANGSAPFQDLRIHDLLNGRNKYGLRRLDSYSYDEKVHRLKTYYKYTIVRHPLVRLVSIYRQAFSIAEFYIREIPGILAKVRPGWTNETAVNNTNKLENYNFTFTEFLNYTFVYANRTFRLNYHWERLTELNHPCAVRYDYIGKLETIKHDAQYLLSTLYNNTNTQLAVTPHNRNTSYNIAIRHFKQVPQPLRRKVIQYYKADANMFGYRFDDFL